MHSTALLSTLALALLPATQAAKAYIPYGWNASVPAIHDQPVTADNIIFDIGDRTTGFCPSWDPECPSQNTTIITGPSDDGSMWMGSLLGHQQIYVTTYGGGMMYTGPDDISIPLEGPDGPFTVEEDAEVGGKVWRLRGADWYFCEYYNVPLKLYAGIDGHPPSQATGTCYSAKIRLEETTAAAVDQYR